MPDNFPAFAKLVAADFQSITKDAHVFVTGVDADALYATYLAAFPEGTNPIFRERTEHDCSCCKQFIRRVGNMVAVTGSGHVRTVWDSAAVEAPYPYNEVASALRDAVRAASVADIFRVAATEASFGAERSHSIDKDTQRALTWDHFYTGPIPNRFRVTSSDAERGEYRTWVQTYERGLTELTPDSAETVLALIDANNLYRGEEHRRAVAAFREAQQAFFAVPAGEMRRVFLWTHVTESASKFRNSAIGTLLQELSAGADVESAVSSFEAKVAPTNYKRTTAVITPGMVKKAMETIEALGLEPALERRFARITDISVGDVLWVDGSTKPLMKGGLGEALMQHATSANPRSAEDDEARAEEIGVDDFLARVLPEATGMEVLFKSAHLGNLVSLTAPVHPEPKHLFKWGNDFAWSYAGNVADSIAERVKKAGGKVEGAALRVSLSWSNYDDLDLHVHEPPGRGVYGEIYYGNKRGWTGGVLDVDMNAHVGTTREPVENVVWMQAVPDGAYKVIVNNFAQRETTGVGFVVEVESAGRVSHFSYNKIVRNRGDVHVVTLHVKGGAIARVEAGDPAITASNVSKEVWGLQTEQYAKVSAVTLSPNYWNGSTVGNKHTFFLLDGAKCDEPTRGIYNEFLHSRLEPHRKVFEVIGDKTKCQPTDGGLSGLGFSSTKKDAVLVKVQQGKRQRVFNVKVGG